MTRDDAGMTQFQSEIPVFDNELKRRLHNDAWLMFCAHKARFAKADPYARNLDELALVATRAEFIGLHPELDAQQLWFRVAGP